MPNTALEDDHIEKVAQRVCAHRAGNPKGLSFTDEQLREMGYLCWRRLPDGDLMGVLEMTFGKGRLCLGLTPAGYEQGYCYATLVGAIAAMANFQPDVDDEPQGWFRDINDGRRRPNGDVSQEYVAL